LQIQKIKNSELATGRRDSYGVEMNICVACGGTGGHIFPGVATAQELSSRGHDVTLWLAGREVEADSISGWNGKTVSMTAARLPAGKSLKAVAALVRILIVVFKSWLKMCKIRPDVVLAMGSYTSVGAVMAAALLRIPVVLHEANSVPGKAITVLSRFAKYIGITFPSAAEYLDSSKTVITGFPLRRSLHKTEKSAENDKNFTLLVMGGSQGAHALNEVVPQALIILYQRGIKPDIIHLTGARDAANVEALYNKNSITAEVHAFAKDMESVYAKADFGITRAGAATCTELAVCGVPALLIPYPFAAKNHQMLNAMDMARQGGMAMQPEQDLTAEWLAGYLQQIIEDSERLDTMRVKLENSAIANGAEQLADLVEKAAAE
jgi:UDP-N-acetylglucosamine--N-acetylmuramyl-(pentapeptide) pyrophosphoryl-undecaprenol N-acetylglucosamine transferase